jgi:dehydrogenase/reductase SDR family protein 12
MTATPHAAAAHVGPTCGAKSPASNACGAALAWREVVDSLLEATVVLSWSRVGYVTRQAIWHWGADELSSSLRGRQVVITGGTNGLGKATATALVRAGASVCLVGRDPSRAALAAQEVNTVASALSSKSGTNAVAAWPAGGPPSTPGAWAETADVSSLEQVRLLAGRLSGRLNRLDALVHAAGGIAHSYKVVEEGIELTFATHVVGPHLLTALLSPLLAAGSPSTVVWVSSGGAYLQPLKVDLLRKGPSPYRGTVSYALAKRAQLALARRWADELAGNGTATVAMHPGWALTDGLLRGLPRFARMFRPVLRTPQQGADTIAWLAAGKAGPCPKVAFWFDRSPRAEHKLPLSAYAPKEEQRLWDLCYELVGTQVDKPSAGPR